MSLHAYHVSRAIEQKDLPFEALIMAAMRKADSYNALKLTNAFPGIWNEFAKRYNAPLGVIPEDGQVDMDVLAKQVELILKSWPHPRTHRRNSDTAVPLPAVPNRKRER